MSTMQLCCNQSQVRLAIHSFIAGETDQLPEDIYPLVGETVLPGVCQSVSHRQWLLSQLLREAHISILYTQNCCYIQSLFGLETLQ